MQDPIRPSLTCKFTAYLPRLRLSGDRKLYLKRPTILVSSISKILDGGRQVGGEGAVHVGLKCVQVNLDHLDGILEVKKVEAVDEEICKFSEESTLDLVVLAAGVRREKRGFVLLRLRGDGLPLGGHKVINLDQSREAFIQL